MKKIKIIVSAFAVFAVVGSALAFKAKIQPTLSTCNAQGVCVLTTDKNDQGRGLPIINPGNLFKGNGSCTGANPPCVPYAGQVFQSN